MDISFNQVVHELVGLIKYAIALVVMVVVVKILLPMFWGHACYVDPDDLGMQDALGKTTLKVPFNPGEWTEDYVKRGDIVIVNQVSNDESAARRDFPFRVVAVPGDMIRASRGEFTVNGKPEKKPIADGETKVLPHRVPRGYVYVLPDNRRECRGGQPGMIPAWRIVGKLED